MRIYDFLLTIASQLGDARPGAEFRRYTLRDLTAYYTEAMCFVAAHRPDLFTNYVIMKLQPGITQDARCCNCNDVRKVVAQIDEDGNTVKLLGDLSSSGSDKSKWFRAPCKATSSGETVTMITGIEITPGMNGQFDVTPPIKPGENVWVKLQCVQSAPQICESDVMSGASMGTCTFHPAIRSYILYRALQGDRHAVGASTEAQNELKNVYSYLGLVYKMEKEIGSEV